MYKRIEPNNKIFKSTEFQKDRYKFNIIYEILRGEETLLYSDEENYIFARNEAGKPTWIWTKDNMDESKASEIKELIEIYMTGNEKDQFTCKKEMYDCLVKTNFDKINKEDYFELGFLICNRVKDVKKADGSMKLATYDDFENLSKLILKFEDFANKTLKNNDIATIEIARQKTEKLIETNCLYCWKNENDQIVSIAKYKLYENDKVARIGHVYTLEEERRKGYATNLIHNLTEKILNDGFVPLLYTDYKYIPSNRAYINAGYEYKGILINFSCSKNK